MLAIAQNRKPKTFNCPIFDWLLPSVELAGIAVNFLKHASYHAKKPSVHRFPRILDLV